MALGCPHSCKPGKRILQNTHVQGPASGRRNEHVWKAQPSSWLSLKMGGSPKWRVQNGKSHLKWMLIAFPSTALHSDPGSSHRPCSSKSLASLAPRSPNEGDHTTDPLGIWWQLVAVLGGNPNHNVEEIARGLHWLPYFVIGQPVSFHLRHNPHMISLSRAAHWAWESELKLTYGPSKVLHHWGQCR